MSTISMQTTLTYDKINSFLQEIKEFAIQKQSKYLSTVMQFVDLNDYWVQISETADDNWQILLQSVTNFFCLVHVSVQQFTLVCVFVYMYFFLIVYM